MLLASKRLRPFASQVHSCITTLHKAIAALSIMRDHCAVDGALIVLGDATDDHPICSGRLSIVGLAALDREFEVGFVCVREGEVLVVIVDMRVFVFA